MSNLTPSSSSSANWQLLRIWHVETLSTVAHSPKAYRFLRASYCIVPAFWRDMAEQGLFDRLVYLLGLSYRSRNYHSSRSGDTAEMWWVAFGFEWVEHHTMAARAPADDDDERISVRIDRDIHADVIDAAAAEVIAAWHVSRPGIAERPWASGFSAFRVDADGETCHLVRPLEADAVFDAAFASAMRAAG